MNVDPIDYPVGIGDGLQVRKNLNSNSPVIGLHSEWWLTDKLALHLKADCGGFGVDYMDETYQGVGWLAYHFQWGKRHAKALAGYRNVYLDLKDDRVELDVTIKGPLLGIGFDF